MIVNLHISVYRYALKLRRCVADYLFLSSKFSSSFLLPFTFSCFDIYLARKNLIEGVTTCVV